MCQSYRSTVAKIPKSWTSKFAPKKRQPKKMQKMLLIMVLRVGLCAGLCAGLRVVLCVGLCVELSEGEYDMGQWFKADLLSNKTIKLFERLR